METKYDLTKRPSWLELPDEQLEPSKIQLWCCQGIRTPSKKSVWWKRKPDVIDNEGWALLFASPEEAEAHASSEINPLWKWNGKEAVPASLKQSLFKARSKGYLGVGILGYKNGEWTTIRKFPVGVPLFEDLDSQ